MKKRLRKILLYSFSSIFMLVITLWAILFAYVNIQQKELVAKIEKGIYEQISGNVHVEGIQPDFTRTFPYVSFRVDGLSITDSLYEKHHTKFLDVKHIYIRLSIPSIFKGTPQVAKLIVDDGKMHVFVNDTGYSNNYLFKPKKERPKDPSKSKPSLNKIEFNDFAFLFINTPLDKNFDLNFQKLNLNVNDKGAIKIFRLATTAHIGQLGFNLDNGAFLKDANLKANFVIRFADSNRSVNIDKTTLNINGEKVAFAANVIIDSAKTLPFNITFGAPKINFNKAVKWMNNGIYNALSDFEFKQTLALNASISGSLTARRIDPQVYLTFNTSKNTAKILNFDLANISFKGSFDNRFQKSMLQSDVNSCLKIDTFNANFDGLPLMASGIQLTNLITPNVKANLKANFPAKVLNNFIGKQFKFSKGNASYDLKYDGELFPKTLIARELWGSIKFLNTDFEYVQRKLKFENSNLELAFQGDDLNLKKFELKSGKSDLKISGIIYSFLSGIWEKRPTNMNLQLNSNNIDFGSFQTYFVQKRNANLAIDTVSQNSFATRLDAFLNQTNVQLAVNINNANYQKFSIAQLGALFHFTPNSISIDHLDLIHGGGLLILHAHIKQEANDNPFDIKFLINGVKVDKFFYAMDNFGFDGLTHENLEGIISVNGDLEGKLSGEGKLIKEALKGNLSFRLSNAALKDFGPFQNINLFKKRNLDRINIDNFSGRLSVQNGIIEMPYTNLHTSVLHVSFEGIYGFSPGKPTAINITVPLRNPQAAKGNSQMGANKPKKEGLKLDFNATSDSLGKIIIDAGKVDISKVKQRLM